MQHWPVVWICAGIFLVTLLAYWPALSGGFIWDDDGHVTRADLRGLSGLFRIWTEFGATQQYYPVLHSAFWLEYHVWGDSPLGYHLLNVLLHALAAGLFGILLRRLAVPGATLAALLFALHPVCVESVAWISEQKNTLSLVFYLCAALAYLRFTERRRGTDYGLATGVFLLALMTKTVTASLPAALLVVFWWQRGKLEWKRDVLPLLPWFVLGAASGLVTAHFERVLIGAQGHDFDLGLGQRCLLAGRVFWFYLGNLIWPAELIFIYPRWTVDASIWWQWLFSPAVIVLLVGLWWWQRKQRGPLAAMLLFAGSLFPVLGFVNVYPFIFSYVADHFQYLASLALFALAGAGLMKASARLPRWVQTTAGVVLLAGLGTLSWAQSRMYRDNLTLYQTILERNPSCWMAHNNLATTLTEAGQIEEAVPHLALTLKLRPDYPQALNNLGDDLTRLGRPREAIPYLERALTLQPTFFQAHTNLGSALLAVNRPVEAITHHEEAIRLNPQYATAEKSLGVALAQTNRTAEAILHFQRAIQLEPNFAEAELSWAIALMLTGRFPEAVPHFEKAIALDPETVELRRTYAQALVQANRYTEAIAQYEKAVELDPEHAVTQMNLALGLRQMGRLKEAAEHYQEAIRLNPDLARSR
jgi:tetratricopeptide (TPR) repeat protein